MPRRRGFYEPEDLGCDQDRRDAARPGRRFHVYVLGTDYGHYVGHTAHVPARLRQHRRGEVPSTAGGNPSLLWSSGPLPTRRNAASFEAALKALRQRRSPRFAEITGVEPLPFRSLRRRGGRRGLRPAARRRGRGLRGLLGGRRRRRLWLILALAAILLARAAGDAWGGPPF